MIGRKYSFLDIYSLDTLRKHAYSNILEISPPKTKSFQIKILIFFHVPAQNIAEKKKNNVYPCKPQFNYINVGSKRGQNYVGNNYVFVMTTT